jgi:trans-aconitate methyltransferase
MKGSMRDFLATTRERAVHPSVEVAAQFMPETGDAIDLGCGAGNATLWLLARGYRVTAVDSDADAIAALATRVPADAPLELVHRTFEELAFERRYAVACALYSLFYLAPAAHAAFWSRLVEALAPGGVFVGQLLGERDDWRGDGTTFSRDTIEGELDDLEILGCHEEERDGPTALGEIKHWHVFHVIARKP